MRHQFMNLELEVGPGVLIPRAETELLANTAIGLIAAQSAPLVVDMCCGSGNVALAIAAGQATAILYGSDIAEESVESARRNAERLGLTSRVTFEQGNMFAALERHDLSGKVDLVACNPPYISTGKLDTHYAHLLANEPREAFDAGPYGIAIHQQLITEAAAFLRAGAWLVFEFGAGQDRQALALLGRSRKYTEIAVRCTSAGVPRVAMARRIAPT